MEAQCLKTDRGSCGLEPRSMGLQKLLHCARPPLQGHSTPLGLRVGLPSVLHLYL